MQVRICFMIKQDTLYYDGACPLCCAEINQLLRLSRSGLTLVDIHKLEIGEVCIPRQRLLSRLHLKTSEGVWITGLSANIRAWQHTPFGFIWRVLDWPVINWFSYRAYEHWLQRRNQNICSAR